MIAYRAMLDVPRELVAFVSGLLRAHRRVLGTRKGTRILTPWRHAVFGPGCRQSRLGEAEQVQRSVAVAGVVAVGGGDVGEAGQA